MKKKMKQYHELLKHVLKHGESHDDRTGVGTISIFGYQTRFDLREGFPIVTTKRLPFRWIAEELFWFLRGSTDEGELRKVGVDIWKEWATEEQCGKFGREPGDLGPIYGFLWRNFGGQQPFNPDAIRYTGRIERANDGIDQIDRLMYDLKQNPNSRRHIVGGWDPRECDNVSLPPCHTLWQIKVHPNQYLSLHLYARSIDSFLGLPFNISSYALLLTLIAAASGYEPKELIISFGDLHIYENHLNQLEELLSRNPLPLPHLELKNMTGNTPLEKLLNVKWKDLSLVNYIAHPPIKAEVAI